MMLPNASPAASHRAAQSPITTNKGKTTSDGRTSAMFREKSQSTGYIEKSSG
jgi:hypothetical protein